jgi:iron complex outermembrane receptor protein
MKEKKTVLIFVFRATPQSKTIKLTPNIIFPYNCFVNLARIRRGLVGSRNKKRVANDTPVAIDFIDIEKTAS